MTQTPPVLERFRHELVRRHVTVAAVQRLTPHMQRITLAGEALAGLTSLGFDDHFKLMVGDARRDYTPRHFDAARCELTVDFALHQAGPATDWALQAAVGDEVQIGGPRGSQVIGGVGRWLLIGDETALPAIGRKAEEAVVPVTTLVAVPGPDDVQIFAGARQHWVYRDEALAADPAALLSAAEALPLTPDTFVWIAAEARVARALRDLFTGRGHDLQWIKASGYWVKGVADGSEKM